MNNEIVLSSEHGVGHSRTRLTVVQGRTNHNHADHEFMIPQCADGEELELLNEETLYNMKWKDKKG